ncbi:MAG: hypothetical protein JJE22_14055 [Bacteroidia bacterium]|nr:hypothetical protein [Bacteroidia bacterium]
MPLSLDEFRCKLINKILFAGSQNEVKRFCNAVMSALEHHKVNGHIIVRFVDKVISELELFNPMQKDAQQWSNIQMAKIQFNRIKKQISATVN